MQQYSNLIEAIDGLRKEGSLKILILSNNVLNAGMVNLKFFMTNL